MICMKNLEEIKIMCRICLTQNESGITLDSKIDTSEGNLFISDALENMLSVQINENSNFPRGICKLCYGNIRILFDLKHVFTKSQIILEKYVSTLESEEYVTSFKDLTRDQDQSFVDYTENEDSQMSEQSLWEENDDSTAEPKPDIEEHDLMDDVNDQENITRVEVDTKDINASKVKREEGNKFVIQRSGYIPKTLQKCVHCDKRFLTKEKLNTHLATSCKKYVNIKCDLCGNQFSSEARKEQHMNLKHNSNSSQLKCEICNITFKNHNARSYHKLTRHSTEGKKYKCELCGKAFFIKNSLNQHMECHSRDVSKVVCPICGKGFHYRGGLFYHMKIHRNERNYICEYCKRRFLTMASLKRHTRIHTGERPYTCSLCSKSFCSIGEVKTHERRHTGQKPHPCKYCSKSFISPYNLKLHISSHAGTVPCDFCFKSFLNSEALKYHLDIKHYIRDKKPSLEVINN